MSDTAAHIESSKRSPTPPAALQETSPAPANEPAAAATETLVDSSHVSVASLNEDEEEEEDGPGVLDDGDSGFGSGRSIEWTDSLASSVRHYREAYGRTYHSFKEGKYHAPNDEREQDRLALDLQNHLYTMTFEGKLHLAPIPKDIQNCLDVGTGTGLWATDFGISLLKIRPLLANRSKPTCIQAAKVPPNVEFLIDDAEEEWQFPVKFDLVHSRMMVGSFASWPKFISNAYDALKPGGWIEIQDVGDLVSDTQDISNTGIDQWYRTALAAFRQAGREVKIPHLFKQMVIDAGFEDVHEEIFKWPLNTWPKDEKMKELGLWSRENIMDAIEAWSIVPFTQVLGMSLAETHLSQARARTSLKDTRIHAYWRVHVIYGRKPLGDGPPASDF